MILYFGIKDDAALEEKCRIYLISAMWKKSLFNLHLIEHIQASIARITM